MDALTDHFADLIIQARAPQISDEITPEAFARAVWLFARAVSAERARLNAEDIEELLRKSHKIPAAASADVSTGGGIQPPTVPPTQPGPTAGEVVDAELAPFLEATKELRGWPVPAGRTCAAGDARSACTTPAVEQVGHMALCFGDARAEFASIAQMDGIEAARAESSNFSTEEDKNAAAERGTSGALLRQEPAGRAAGGGGGHEGERGRNGGPERAPDDAHLREHGRPGRNDADRGDLDLAPVRPVEGRAASAAEGPGDVAIRGPATPDEASRGGIAPAAPEDGAQPAPAEVAGHAAEEVAQGAASPVQPVQEVKHEEPLVDANAKVTPEEVAVAKVATAPRSGKRGRKKKDAAPVGCRTEEQPEDKQVPLTTWPRWGRTEGAHFAWHLWPFDGAGEALCEEATDADVVWLQPGEDRDPELTCNDCPLIAERHVPVVVATGDPGVTAIAHVAPNLSAESKAALEDIAKAAVKALRGSMPRAGKKKAAKATGVRCGGPDCRVVESIEHHTPATCPRFKPREPVTPRPEGARRARALAETMADGKAAP